MSQPVLSEHFQKRKPSAIRLAQIEFMKRNDSTKEVNTAIGNVSLPMHPAMKKRLFALKDNNSPFQEGIVKYTATVGLKETNDAVLNIIASSGLDTSKLYSQITDGGSQAMELVIIGCCGPAGTNARPLMLIDAAYTNYNALASRVGRDTVSVSRTLGDDGRFSLPDMAKIEAVIQKHQPGALVVIPYDNPTGQFMTRDALKSLAQLVVKYNMWMISDEAYRELYYVDEPVSSIWNLSDQEIPGIEGRRISIETSSKVWNACGLRIGALVTDNQQFHQQSVAENTANLCSNAIGQYIFGSLAKESHEDLKAWYSKQRQYYRNLLFEVHKELTQTLPGIIVSSPDASIYSVVDVKNIAKPGFNALDFVMFCAQKGSVPINEENYTLLVAPMAGFYSVAQGE
ncbi:MAG: aminotransferase class I/II-fold pyridoxal phosphate-dependent enzyme, partial [Spirochaetes bacterium]|nr:aminotransferase class I/II-fold pyridoxal phosphate-dependent enzyme [Spirochaetota bacterium]